MSVTLTQSLVKVAAVIAAIDDGDADVHTEAVAGRQAGGQSRIADAGGRSSVYASLARSPACSIPRQGRTDE